MGLTFEWDPRKAATNRRKHGISFEEATSIFGDGLSMTMQDPMHSVDEQRWITIGRSQAERLLVVVHTDRADHIHLISARLATRTEGLAYAEGN